MNNSNKVLIMLSVIVVVLAGMLLYKIFVPKTIDEATENNEKNMDISNINTYSNETLKLDIPKNYTYYDYKPLEVFVSDDSIHGIVISIEEDIGLKRDINSITQKEIDEVVAKSNNAGKIINQEKEQLGKHQAIKLRMKNEENTYTDLYILASDKHTIQLMFTGNSAEDLDNIEYQNIKESFEIKEEITNPIIYKLKIFIITILIIIIAGVIRRKINISSIY